MKGLAFTSAPDTNNTDLITMIHGATAITVTPMNIGGTDGIIGTIIIGIEARVFSPIKGLRRDCGMIMQ